MAWTGNVTKPFLGYVALKKISGSGPIANATQINLPAARAMPVNPRNIAYPGVINASSYASLSVLGKKSPAFSIVAFAKPSWFTASFLNSLLFGLDAAGNTDLWAVAAKDDQNLRVWDWCRCASVTLYQTAPGGPVTVEMGFFSRWGENECPYGTTLYDTEVLPAATTFQIPANADAGALIDVTGHDWGSSPTATHVRSWRLSLMRGQGYVYYLDKTLYPKDIASSMFGGSLVLEQSPTATVVPTTAITCRLNVQGGAGNIIQMLLALSLDSEAMDHDLGFGNFVRTYTLLAGNGGNPCVVSAV